MNKFFKKNQKKILALFSVGLMVAFALPQALTSHEATGDQKRGKMGTQTLTDSEINGTKNEVELLTKYIYLSFGPNQDGTVAYEPAIVQLTMAYDELPQEFKEIFRNPMYRAQFRQSIMPIYDQLTTIGHEPMFALMIHEARQMGVEVSDDQLKSALANMRVMPGTVDEQQAQHAVYDMLLVRNAFSCLGDIIKVPDDEVIRRLGIEHQQICVDLVEFNSKDYLDKTKPPTAEEINRQYQTYMYVMPQNTQNGFGYLQPARVAFQYIEISHDQLAKAVESKVRALGAMKTFYLENQHLYTTETGGLGSLGPSTHSTVRDYDTDITVREDVYNRLQKKYIDELVSQILPDISRTLERDYRAWRAIYDTESVPLREKAKADGLSPDSELVREVDHPTQLSGVQLNRPPTPLGRPYPSYDYLRNLAMAMQDAHGVLPAVGSVATPQSMQELNDAGLPPMKPLPATYPTTEAATQAVTRMATQPALAATTMPSTTEPAQASKSPVPPGLARARTDPQTDVTFPEYAVDYAAALVNTSSRPQTPVGLLELYQPSMVLTDEQGNYWIFRLTQIAPPRPYDKVQVEDRLEADCRRIEAANLAAAAAQALKVSALSQGLNSAASTTRPSYTVQTTGFFSLNRCGPKDLAPFALPTDRERGMFAQRAMRLLLTRRAADPKHPVELIDLSEVDRLFVVELRDIKPEWTTQDLGFVRANYVTTSLFTQKLGIAAKWFNYDNLIARVDYKKLDNKGD